MHADRRAQGTVVTFVVEELRVRRGAATILEGVSFAVDSGERVTVTGSNGAGKTTLLKTLLGILPVDSGTIRVDGTPVGTSSWRRIRHRAGYVSQQAVHTDFPITVAEVVGIGCIGTGLSRAERRDRIRAGLEQTGCSHLLRASWSRLSGGEKQRVSIARCLCRQPRALLLDEPTSSLDPEGKEALLELAERLSAESGITVIMVTHDSGHFQRDGWRRLALAEGRLLP
ncbi:MAG: ATP-binding cassette domain-containing protein [Spirochaetaceae bacterium]|nr:MAG: ATP-binding cassette domain-containing protein [Spirochaetaceae bacterium]